MKKIIIIFLAALIPMSIPTPVSAKVTNKETVKEFCMMKYNMMPVYVKENSSMIKHHKGKMIVEVVKSTSKGKYGKTKRGYKIPYCKKTKKGKKVTSYIIYSPKSNAVDDIVAYVDHSYIYWW